MCTEHPPSTATIISLSSLRRKRSRQEPLQQAQQQERWRPRTQHQPASPIDTDLPLSLYHFPYLAKLAVNVLVKIGYHTVLEYQTLLFPTVCLDPGDTFYNMWADNILYFLTHRRQFVHQDPICPTKFWDSCNFLQTPRSVLQFLSECTYHGYIPHLVKSWVCDSSVKLFFYILFCVEVTLCTASFIL